MAANDNKSYLSYLNKLLERYDATTLTHINQCNTDKVNSEKKLEMLIKNIRYKWISDCNCFEYKN